MLSWKACGLWRDQGARVNRVSPRVISLVIELSGPCGSKVPLFFLQGCAVQQNCPEVERESFWAAMQSTLDLSPTGCARVLAMDVNASIGTRQPQVNWEVPRLHAP